MPGLISAAATGSRCSAYSRGRAIWPPSTALAGRCWRVTSLPYWRLVRYRPNAVGARATADYRATNVSANPRRFAIGAAAAGQRCAISGALRGAVYLRFQPGDPGTLFPIAGVARRGATTGRDATLKDRRRADLLRVRRRMRCRLLSGKAVIYLR